MLMLGCYGSTGQGNLRCIIARNLYKVPLPPGAVLSTSLRKKLVQVFSYSRAHVRIVYKKSSWELP